MELWVRSQDKCTLEKITYLSVGGTYRNEILADDCCSIGKYKSKERALEVLDEIQGRIISNECLKTMLPMVNNIKGYEEKFGELFKEMVYQMPEE